MKLLLGRHYSAKQNWFGQNKTEEGDFFSLIKLCSFRIKIR